jgi:hypothetical protein
LKSFVWSGDWERDWISLSITNFVSFLYLHFMRQSLVNHTYIRSWNNCFAATHPWHCFYFHPFIYLPPTIVYLLSWGLFTCTYYSYSQSIWMKWLQLMVHKVRNSFICVAYFHLIIFCVFVHVTKQACLLKSGISLSTHFFKEVLYP